MSRRVVSYSDISEDVPEPSAMSVSVGQGEAGPSNHLATSGGKDTNGNGGGMKRKQKGMQGGGGGKVRRRVVMHWDDPSYDSSAVREVEGVGYRAHNSNGFSADHDGSLDVGGEGAEVDEEEVDEEDFEVQDEGGEGVDEPYTDWKYDEWGEPYDTSNGNLDGEGQDEYYNYDDEEEPYDSATIPSDLEDNEDEEASLPFAIPDVTEYHRSLDLPLPTTTTSLTSSTSTHRPPREVGGGGRTLLHSEIWGPSTIIDTYNSALHQYCSMHNITPPPRSLTNTSAVALWTDAPAHDSLLAQQVRLDVQQVLAQRKGHTSVIAAAQGVGLNSGGKNGQQRGKPVVTIVPHAGVEGNSAWKKAVKTVQSTPNSIGLPTPTTTTAIDGRISGKEEEEASRRARQEQELHAYWYAGYRAGMAAAAAAAAASAARKKINADTTALGQNDIVDDAAAAAADTIDSNITTNPSATHETPDPAVANPDPTTTNTSISALVEYS
ncbi:uncharacterized protein SPSC_01124 [Sporisorium scitamineum]|uniref:Uncharacterized protein n=1 Tax=Sporisorium scitamineum TaxID=49012 RepID=A0A127Z8T5_9BASI|nr:uncharacterized protein SPSC_01124 [Sporisorium scitamineum]